jgi:hypothetical protein
MVDIETRNGIYVQRMQKGKPNPVKLAYGLRFRMADIRPTEGEPDETFLEEAGIPSVSGGSEEALPGDKYISRVIEGRRSFDQKKAARLRQNSR